VLGKGILSIIFVFMRNEALEFQRLIDRAKIANGDKIGDMSFAENFDEYISMQERSNSSDAYTYRYNLLKAGIKLDLKSYLENAASNWIKLDLRDELEKRITAIRLSDTISELNNNIAAIHVLFDRSAFKSPTYE
jgi:hypothetical protein